ncbi:MAG TPA: isoprenylcysteine carboxylmethyltransferase family protein [Candidatus Dormibacteraeota bacterium]
MQAIGTFFLAAWVAFWGYWIIAAAGAKSQVPRAGAATGVGIRLGIVLLIFLLVRTRALGGDAGLIHIPAVQGLGVVLFVAGLGLAIWARPYLGRNWGMPMSEKVDPELVTSGPYRYVRHPIYSGVILAMVGTGLAVGLYWLIVAAVMGVYFIYSATVEERNMARLFPATYPAYRQHTKMLIPFLL